MLELTKEGKRWKLKGADLQHRVPTKWPAHTNIERWMLTRVEFAAVEVEACFTFEDQLNLIERLPGWSDVKRDPGVVEQLTNICHLMMFGVPPAKVRFSLLSAL
jgi:hypothetical protein